MGSKPSTIFRRVQPYSFQYNRLQSSSQQQPLLDNNDDQYIEQLKLGIEDNRKKNESLEIKNAALEKELGELRVAISKQESRVHPIVEKNVCSLEKEIRELKSAISRLESKSHSVIPGTSVNGSHVALKNEVDKLAHRVMLLELDSLVTIRIHDFEKIVQKNTELENRLAQLTTTIDQLVCTASNKDAHLTNPMEPEHGIQGHQSNDLVGCLIVLIFLVSVLIGVNL